MAWQTIVRRLIPLSLRQEIKHHWRQLHDRAHGIHFDKHKNVIHSAQPIQLTQPIMPGAFYENKMTNIYRGSSLINHTMLAPNCYWSFWQQVHRPSSANGFVTGRNLVNGELIAQLGGGLCQLSSLIYHLALLAGLTIIERHAHSVDIYEEHQRFTALGADATVVWGFKDLRLYNPHAFVVSFQFVVQNGELQGAVYAEDELSAQHVVFARLPLEKPFIQINTLVNNTFIPLQFIIKNKVWESHPLHNTFLLAKIYIAAYLVYKHKSHKKDSKQREQK